MNNHTLKWFQNRISKKIYRDWYKCCKTCDDIAKNGLIIRDKAHAEYIYTIQNEYGSEGTILNYRDHK